MTSIQQAVTKPCNQSRREREKKAKEEKTWRKGIGFKRRMENTMTQTDSRARSRA